MGWDLEPQALQLLHMIFIVARGIWASSPAVAAGLRAKIVQESDDGIWLGLPGVKRAPDCEPEVFLCLELGATSTLLKAQGGGLQLHFCGFCHCSPWETLRWLLKLCHGWVALA